MGLIKSENYTLQQNQLAKLCRVLGHPARIAILQQLLAVDCCICRDLTDELPLAQPTVSRHLKELKSVGLISGTIEGTSVSYCIDAARWREVRGLIDGLFSELGGGEDCC